MKQINIKLLLLLCMFCLYMLCLYYYIMGDVHVTAYLTGTLLGLAGGVLRCVKCPYCDDTDMSYRQVFMYMTTERK